MNNLSDNFAEFPSYIASSERKSLWQYIQSLDSSTLDRLSQPSVEVARIMESNLVEMLGNLPPEDFDVTITTSRTNLGQLLASAMVKGYFFHKAEQMMELEKRLSATEVAE